MDIRPLCEQCPFSNVHCSNALNFCKAKIRRGRDCSPIGSRSPMSHSPCPEGSRSSLLFIFLSVGPPFGRLHGEGGIRTPGGVSPTTAFEAVAFNRARPPLHFLRGPVRQKSRSSDAPAPRGSPRQSLMAVLFSRREFMVGLYPLFQLFQPAVG